jgi:hypothetical protein
MPPMAALFAAVLLLGEALRCLRRGHRAVALAMRQEAAQRTDPSGQSGRCCPEPTHRWGIIIGPAGRQGVVSRSGG